jgi:hypothetical protein
MSNFVNEIISLDHPSMAKQIRKFIARLSDEKKPVLKRGKIHREADADDSAQILTATAEEIAEQLTLIESGCFCAVMV